MDDLYLSKYITDDTMTASDYIHEIQEDIARVHTDVTLVDTFMRKSHRQTRERFEKTDKELKDISKRIGKITDKCDVLIEYIELPWYKKIFMNYKKFKLKNGRKNL